MRTASLPLVLLRTLTACAAPLDAFGPGPDTVAERRSPAA